MYPRTSPQYVRPSVDGAVVSPRKKLNVKSVRETFALPAIHQFTPVLTTAASRSVPNPHDGPEEDAGASEGMQSNAPASLSASKQGLSPHYPPKPRSIDKNSPRLRPQPPPPVAVASVASRTDQDLYRYSQGTKQRMAIRPLFEQRREEEAELARRILTSRETESRQGRLDDSEDQFTSREEGEEEERSVAHRHRASSSRRATTPITAEEIADLRSSTGSLKIGYGSSRSIRTPRSERGRSTGQSDVDTESYTGDSSGPATERGDRSKKYGGEDGEDDDDTLELVSVRFNTPTPPSSAGPSRSHITESSAQATPEGTIRPKEETASETPTAHTTEPAGIASDLHRASSGDAGSDSSARGVEPLEASTFHEPFLQKRASKINWLLRTPSVSSPLSAQDQYSLIKAAAQRATPPPTSVCYKLLWKDARSARHDDGTLGQHEMRVLLGSNGKAHVSIQQNNTEDEEKVEITNADLLASTKSRPDLPVMTPKWAKWLLSRMERDAHGVWFLRIQDIFMMEDCCVFEEDVVITLSHPSDTMTGQLPSPEQPHSVSVAIYLLGGDGNDDTASLLVHARDRTSSTSPPPLTEVILTSHELETVAKTLGFLASSPDPVDADVSSTKELMQKLVRDKDFLRRAIAESKALRLALKSGLHVTEPTNTIDDLPFRIGSRAAKSLRTASGGVDSGDDSMKTEPHGISRTIAEYETQGLSYASPEIQQLIRGNLQLAETAFLAQAYYEDAALAALRWLQRREAVEAYAASYVQGDDDSTTSLSEGVRKRIDAAKLAKLEDIATRSIIEDMIHDFIVTECRMELHHAKYSGGYDDYYASKVQATFRMSYHRRDYMSKRHVRLRAAQLIQALQRGILARRKYCEMRVEREKYMFYGFRSSLHQTTTAIEDPRQRATDLAREIERRRQTFLMQVLHGYVAEHGLPLPFRVSPELVQTLFNEHSVVVGCAATLGDSVAAVLISSRHPQSPKKAEAKAPPPRLFGSQEIHAALVTALRMQYDDTYGLSSNIRRIDARERSPTKAQLMIGSQPKSRQSIANAVISSVGGSSDENTPPRWLLKTSAIFQRANRNRLAALRLTQRATGQRAAHLVALDYRNLLHENFESLDQCRAIWEETIRSRKRQTLEFDGFSVDELVQYALDRLILAVKDWGLDPEPLFEALNLCLLHRLGKQAIALTEQAFNRFAEGVNEMRGKRNIFPLRDEISQELEEFERLLALRCLNIANDSVETVPPSEILHIVLTGNIDDEYLRHALPAILPIANVAEKAKLAEKMVRGYANALYGDAFNSICWSCLDTAESVSVEAAHFLERITRRPLSGDDSDGDDVSTAIRALYLFTGPQALRLLQFLAKVAHFNKPLQRRVLEHLAPFAEDAELYRLASVVCSIDSFEVVTRLFDECFDAKVLYGATRFWVQYGALYGEERAEAARATCLSGLPPSTEEETTGTANDPVAEPPEDTQQTALSETAMITPEPILLSL